ncbi:uncharacterized protein AB675_3664 [Cyphellophora attinorum]|uniref:Uncharacterized protein n=1 Tax=Cyphellophora attinorum TaxID=1664694 RepID=A0A0N1H4N6_9EURO|nr:uncharacterized protein AB675_3664 [Phialophora attinorum]KPI37066.1 hypothetical protein AB675_3664 [Phialophora attinorum]
MDQQLAEKLQNGEVLNYSATSATSAWRNGSLPPAVRRPPRAEWVPGVCTLPLPRSRRNANGFSPLASTNKLDEDADLAAAIQRSLHDVTAPSGSIGSMTGLDADLAAAIEASTLLSIASHNTTSRPSSTTDLRALEVHAATFPNGHALIPTSGESLLCGGRAIIASWPHQVPSDIAPPTMEELMDIVRGVAFREVMLRSRGELLENNEKPNQNSSKPDVEEHNDVPFFRPVLSKSKKKRLRKQRGKLQSQHDKNTESKVTSANNKEEPLSAFLDNTTYFSPDQMDVLLDLLGWRRGIRLRLGYLENGVPKLLCRDSGDNGEEVKVLWVYFDTSGIGHYSGLRAL